MKFRVTNVYYSTKVHRVARMMLSSNIRLQGVIIHMITVIRKVVRITFVFDYHFVKYNICLHYHTQFSLVHVSRRAMDDGEGRP